LRNADRVIHAGDFTTEAAYYELSDICPLFAVHGNMDDPALKIALPEHIVIDVEGIRIGAVHQASFSLQDTTGAFYMAKEMNVDILIFGHIHKPVIEGSDVLLVCPGSPTAPRLSEPSAVELIIEKGRISGKIIFFQGTRCSVLESARHFHG
ncbi:MAG TPA: metallophosphoesterase, partial [Candidatus Methanoperedens sp.]